MFLYDTGLRRDDETVSWYSSSSYTRSTKLSVVYVTEVTYVTYNVDEKKTVVSYF